MAAIPMDLDAVVFAANEFLTEFRPKQEENAVVKEACVSVEFSMQRLCFCTKGSVSV